MFDTRYGRMDKTKTPALSSSQRSCADRSTKQVWLNSLQADDQTTVAHPCIKAENLLFPFVGVY